MKQTMEIRCGGLSSPYDIEHLTRLFFPGAPLRKGLSSRGGLVWARIGRRRMAAGLRTEQGCAVSVEALPPGRPLNEKQRRLALSGLLYRVLRQATGVRPPWGMLIGVRPLALLRKLAAGQPDPGNALAEMQWQYDVSPPKLRLLRQAYEGQHKVLSSCTEKDYSLYISIPFCPTRCDYCSFVSRTIQREAHLIEPYLAKLEIELATLARAAEDAGRRLRSVYIGGGTPTVLDAGQLKRLLQSVERYFDTGAAAEYTVEAGRPDCTGYEKLLLLRESGVTRISVNPQSMCDDVLAAIGRRHTAQDIRRCIGDARRAGHRLINMDLIAGLPGDDADSFENSLRQVLAMEPENITVHALTMKRASNLVVEGRESVSRPEEMLRRAYPLLAAAGYAPYYLYRQKKGVDNLENTGWARPGAECLYNIYIMEEAHSILSAGAGGVTKLVAENGQRIQRCYNPKFPLEYLKNHEQVIEAKQTLFDSF